MTELERLKRRIDSLKLLRQDAINRGMIDLAIDYGWIIIELQLEYSNKMIENLNVK